MMSKFIENEVFQDLIKIQKLLKIKHMMNSIFL
jgi:hypothetical protein